MTDHTSTQQASRSRGAAAAANISEAGAILRSLDFLFFPELRRKFARAGVVCL